MTRVRRDRRKATDPTQAYFWTREWQEAEREASADIAAGRVKRAESVEDLIADLEGSERLSEYLGPRSLPEPAGDQGGPHPRP